jgi:hypothetical protein
MRLCVVVTVKQWLAIGLIAASAGACSGDRIADETPAPTLVKASLTDGTPVTDDTVGLPWIGATGSTPGRCSSVVLSDYWVLTAEHCNLKPNVHGETIRRLDGQVITSMRAVHMWPKADVALVRLSTPARAFPRVFHNGLYRGSTASLQGRTLTCYGWAGGVLRTKNLTVTQTNTDGGKKFITTSGPTPGDSGGPCLVDEGGTSYVAGISITSDNNGGGVYASAEVFRTWVDRVMTADPGPTEMIVTTDPGWEGQTSVLDNQVYFTPSAMLILNDAVSSVRIGSMASATLYEHANFAGASIPIFPSGDIYDLAPNFMNNQASSAVVAHEACRLPNANEVTVYSDANFSGACDTVRSGSIDDISILNVGNDGVSSIRVGSAVLVTLYDDIGFGGEPLVANGDVADLSFFFNDRASSLRVNARACFAPGPDEVTVYDDIDFMGACQTFPVDSRVSLSALNDRITSIQVGSQASVALHEHASVQGDEQLNLFADHPFLYALGRNTVTGSQNWNDRISSLWVRRAAFCPPPSANEVVLYEDDNFNGLCTKLPVGNYNRASDFLLRPEQVTSVRIGSAVKLKLFTGEIAGTGSSVTLTSDFGNLSSVPRGSNATWNNAAFSVAVSPR